MFTEVLQSSSNPSKRPPAGRRRLKPNATKSCCAFVFVMMLLACAFDFYPRAPSTSNNRRHATTHTFSGRVDVEGDDGEGAAVFEASNRPLVAVYFTGQARTLHRTICSIRRHLFAPLVRQGFAPVVFVVGESDGNEAGDDPSVSPNYTIRSTISLAATCTACGVRLIVL